MSKVLDKLVSQRILHHYHWNNLLNPLQHGFRTSKSCETAEFELREVVLERVRRNQGVCMISLDVAGAFDNVRWVSILYQLGEAACPLNIFRLVRSYLRNRSVCYETQVTRVVHEVNRGCPQGSCSGPLFWNIVADSLLSLPFPCNTYVQAYADDLVLVVWGHNESQIAERARAAMSLIEEQVFFLLKPGRDRSIISSYRPICLLPTLGKLIERLFINQFNSFIIRHNLIHQFQFGFRELSNCEVAVKSLISKIRASREGNHVALVSIDIKAAFDSLDWEVLFQLFKKYDFPFNIQNFIFSYLKDRQVSYVNALDFITVEVCQGCPQGSVLAPHIWNFYFNEILYLSNDHSYLQAYADDLALLVVADSRKKLETEVYSFLDDLSDNLKVLNLKVASEKTPVVVFRGTQNKNKQKKGALGSVGLSWVKAHAGIPGNELADQFAKSAITEGNFLDIPAPYSFLKKYIKNIILSDWQQHWGESDTGVRVREYVPFVDFNLLTHNRYLLFFISGHGPFPAYLFRFKILNSPNCICGGLGDPDHFVFDYPHTKDFHLTCPSGIFKPDWFSSVLKNVGSLRRLQEICVISNRICNELKSLN
ncbi:hypothetical protein AVEN_81070-1 [Araneus ventricosus]|uniref:Reverse transcriptase domain-containing protein n=1 Tax=Araneus ventricosus TaxID=182803 RepID=A0A4Y2M5E4_ARAVE|nr:hypothetical protein AVEN_81070-1 [Araneus ventricosus]